MATPVKEKSFESDTSVKWPRAFLFRRLHSLLGVWLVLYLFEHLLINSQAALITQDDGYGFISMVNKIHQLPYLPVIELVFLGIPFLIHGVWGVIYLRTGKLNNLPTDGSAPALPQYKRNRAYSWQRITSWILLFGIVAHVIHMRFVDVPTVSYRGMTQSYIVPVMMDNSLYGLAEKLHVVLFDQAAIKDQDALKTAVKKPLKPRQVLAVSPNAGTAFLLIVRDTFKSPLMVTLYVILVLATSFHAFNGLWTACITWGITLTRRSQRTMRYITTFFMLLVIFFGLLATVGTYLTTKG